MSLLTCIPLAILFLLPFTTPMYSPKGATVHTPSGGTVVHLLKSKGFSDVAGCHRAIAQFPTGRPFHIEPPEGASPSSNGVEHQSSAVTIPQNFKEGRCVISVWPSMPGVPDLAVDVNLLDRHVISELDWQDLQNAAHNFLGSLEKEDIRGGRISTQVGGRWFTVQVFTDEEQKPQETFRPAHQPFRPNLGRSSLDGLSRAPKLDRASIDSTRSLSRLSRAPNLSRSSMDDVPRAPNSDRASMDSIRSIRPFHAPLSRASIESADYQRFGYEEESYA